MEVLSIVCNLNENIYQVAVSLTEGWEKYRRPLVEWKSILLLNPASPRPASPQPGPHEFDFPTPAVSLLQGRKHDFELGALPGVSCTKVRLPTLIRVR